MPVTRFIGAVAATLTVPLTTGTELQAQSAACAYVGQYITINGHCRDIQDDEQDDIKDAIDDFIANPTTVCLEAGDAGKAWASQAADSFAVGDTLIHPNTYEMGALSLFQPGTHHLLGGAIKADCLDDDFLMGKTGLHEGFHRYCQSPEGSDMSACQQCAASPNVEECYDDLVEDCGSEHLAQAFVLVGHWQPSTVRREDDRGRVGRHSASSAAVPANDSIAEALLVAAINATIEAYPQVDSAGKRWAIGQRRDEDLSRTLNMRIARDERVLENVARSLRLEAVPVDDVLICVESRGPGPSCGLIGLDMLFTPTIMEYAGDTAVVRVSLQAGDSERLVLGARNEVVGLEMKLVDGTWEVTRMITLVV